jgi:hypothetical protein
VHEFENNRTEEPRAPEDAHMPALVLTRKPRAWGAKSFCAWRVSFASQALRQLEISPAARSPRKNANNFQETAPQV